MHAPGVNNQNCHFTENSITLSFDFYMYDLEQSNYIDPQHAKNSFLYDQKNYTHIKPYFSDFS
jgi:hypothetical protein